MPSINGQIRRSQLVTTFGPGSLLDLPLYSAIVSGLEEWSKGEKILEPRLVAKLEAILGIKNLELYAPPADIDGWSQPKVGITVFRFPEWFVTQDVCHKGNVRSRMLVHLQALRKEKYEDRDGKKWAVVPIRFVRACRHGHIGDIDWYAFVHRGENLCKAQGRQLWLDERGTSGDLGEVWIRCDCKAERSLIEALNLEIAALGTCDGARPWLGQYSREACQERNRLLVRSAVYAYFPQILSVISLPQEDEDLIAIIEKYWVHLGVVQNMSQLKMVRDLYKDQLNDLARYSDDEVMAGIERKRKGEKSFLEKPVKEAELEVLLLDRDTIGVDKYDSAFYATALFRNGGPAPWENILDRVILIHRLREVVAQVGFTRFEAYAPDTQGELDLGVRPAALARETSWLPAIENRGEGIFLAFKKEAIEAWSKSDPVKKREEQLRTGFQNWKKEHSRSKREFPGIAYIMLHSFAHLLLTVIAIECGYPASSIRERVYASDRGYGILLYTGSSDAEGTLGGLVEAGRKIGYHIKAALEYGKLCSYDPVCAQHEPEVSHEGKHLLGAACHGCLLIAETSCEQHNDFLDRSLVVPTVALDDAAFFREE